MDRVKSCLTKHFVRAISNKMIANRIHVTAEGSGESSFLKNAWRTHRETNESLKKSRDKFHSLLLGQCTQVLADKMKQDVDWVANSELFDPNLLFKLIERGHSQAV
jgi:hypothetical protein